MALANTYRGTPCKRGHDGARYIKSGQCVECVGAAGAAWAKANPAKRRAIRDSWRRANPERSRASSASWPKANRERSREHKAKWDKANRAKKTAYRRANSDKQRAYSEKYRRAHMAAAAAKSARHNARKRNAHGQGVTARQWQVVLVETLGLCAYCHERRPLTLDHIESLARNGAHDTENAAAVCGPCNSSKADKPLLLWLALRALARAA